MQYLLRYLRRQRSWYGIQIFATKPHKAQVRTPLITNLAVYCILGREIQSPETSQWLGIASLLRGVRALKVAANAGIAVLLHKSLCNTNSAICAGINHGLGGLFKTRVHYNDAFYCPTDMFTLHCSLLRFSSHKNSIAAKKMAVGLLLN